MTNKTIGSMLSVEQALSRIVSKTSVLESVTVPLSEAYGRILSEDLTALRTQPPFSASAMDGYAVRAEDLLSGNTNLRVVGEVPAGHVFKGQLSQGECVRIFTGAPLPDGADSILIQENVSVLDNGEIQTSAMVKTGEYVRPAGLDFAEGDKVLGKGTHLDAGPLSLAASANYARLNVVRRPRVGILATGDELRPPGSALGPGQIVASNTYGVAAIAKKHGAEIIDLGIAADNRDALVKALSGAQDANCDVLVTLGGASVGDHDLVRSVFVEAGMALDFWKIAMRPGKPLMYGQLDRMNILGLPGNPVSSLVCSHLFLVPLIRALEGGRFQQIRGRAALRQALKANGSREQYARSHVTNGPNGFEADVFENQDSSVVSLYAKANALVVRPIDAPPAAAGETVEFIEIQQIR